MTKKGDDKTWIHLQLVNIAKLCPQIIVLHMYNMTHIIRSVYVSLGEGNEEDNRILNTKHFMFNEYEQVQFRLYFIVYIGSDCVFATWIHQIHKASLNPVE